MKKILVIAVTLLLSACTSLPEYKGPDAGRIVVGIGAEAPHTFATSISLMVRKVGTKETLRLVYFQNNMFSEQKRDYDRPNENGVVYFSQVSPGNYEIYNFLVRLSGAAEMEFSSRKDFSVPFVVRAKETTYLGNYQANVVTGKNIFGISVPAGYVFVVSNREQDDLALGKKRIPLADYGLIENATPAIKALTSPYFVGEDERPDHSKK
jgi:hypothetical protein